MKLTTYGGAMYHATECIFDALAAYGPASFNGLLRNAKAQVTEPCAQKYPITGVELALRALEDAGIVEYAESDKAYELTDYGYELVAGQSAREREYRNHRLTLLMR